MTKIYYGSGSMEDFDWENIMDYFGLEKFIKLFTTILIIFVPLGLWKLFEIIGWIWSKLCQ
jgi:hypothetical protein